MATSLHWWLRHGVATWLWANPTGWSWRNSPFVVRSRGEGYFQLSALTASLRDAPVPGRHRYPPLPRLTRPRRNPGPRGDVAVPPAASPSPASITSATSSESPFRFSRSDAYTLGDGRRASRER